MIITIWRHGQAGTAVTDQLRQLTAVGAEHVRYGCGQFRLMCDDRSLPLPQQVLHSPWVRTSQTADIIVQTFTQALLRPLTALQPGSDTNAVDTALGALQRESDRPRHLLLVSHQPLVSRLADYYLGAPGQVPALSPGALVTLELEVVAPACGKLLFWALPPQYEAHT